MDPDKVEARCAKKVSRESEKASGFCNLPSNSATSKLDQRSQTNTRVRPDRAEHMKYTRVSKCANNYDNLAHIKNRKRNEMFEDIL